MDQAPIAWLTVLLHHLSFTIPRPSTTKQESIEWFLKQVAVRHVLQPAVNLKLLVIMGGREWRDARCFNILQAKLFAFLRLAVLSLRHIMWKDDTVLLEFIMCH